MLVGENALAEVIHFRGEMIGRLELQLGLFLPARLKQSLAKVTESVLHLNHALSAVNVIVPTDFGTKTAVPLRQRARGKFQREADAFRDFAEAGILLRLVGHTVDFRRFFPGEIAKCVKAINAHIAQRPAVVLRVWISAPCRRAAAASPVVRAPMPPTGTSHSPVPLPIRW